MERFAKTVQSRWLFSQNALSKLLTIFIKKIFITDVRREPKYIPVVRRRGYTDQTTYGLLWPIKYRAALI